MVGALCALRTNDFVYKALQSDFCHSCWSPPQHCVWKHRRSLSNISALLAHPLCAYFLISFPYWGHRHEERIFCASYQLIYFLFFPPCRLNNPVRDITTGGCGDAADRRGWVSKVHINIPQAHSCQNFDFSLTQRCWWGVVSRPRFELFLSLGMSRFLAFYGCFVQSGLAALTASVLNHKGI